MKKLILFSNIMLILSFSLSIYATSNKTFDIREYETFPVSSEIIDGIKEYNENSSSLVPPYELFYEKAYVCSLADSGYAKEVLDEISSGKKSFGDYIPEVWHVIVPGTHGIAKYINDENGGYRCIGYSSPKNLKEPLEIPSYKDIVESAQKTLSESNLKDIKSITYTTLSIYNTQVVYVVCDSGEYLIPFSSRPDFTGLTNGTLYTVEDCFKIIAENDDKDDTILEKYFWITLIIFVMIVVASVVAIVLYREKISKRADNLQE